MSVEDGAAQKREIPNKKGGGGGVMTADGKERKVVVVKGCPAQWGPLDAEGFMVCWTLQLVAYGMVCVM